MPTNPLFGQADKCGDIKEFSAEKTGRKTRAKPLSEHPVDRYHLVYPL